MGLVRFDSDADHEIFGKYSHGRGPILRSDALEVGRVRFGKGQGAIAHAHVEEQVFYVLSGRLRVTLEGQEPYEVGEGEASFHPSNLTHAVEALEDTTALQFKNVVDPLYEATGRLQ